MKIAILGAGATGSIYTSYLCNHNETYMVDIDLEHLSAVKNRGLEIERNGETSVFHPLVSSNPSEVGCCDMVIVLVKTYQTAEAMSDSLALLGPNTLVLSLQNGLGNHYELLKYVDRQNILIGTCAQGGTKLGPGRVRHVGAGATEIGSICGNKAAEARILSTFKNAGIPLVSISSNIMESVWKKVIRNAGINAITALLRETTDVVIKNPFAHAICSQLACEAIEVANQCGCCIQPDSMLDVLYKGAQNNGKNRSSMLQDIEHSRPTEIMQINGAVVSEAKKLGMSAPCNEMITNLILALESGF